MSGHETAINQEGTFMKEVTNKRKQSKVSQFKLALTSGVSRFRISMAESGYLQLCADEVAALKKALDLILKQQAEARDV